MAEDDDVVDVGLGGVRIAEVSATASSPTTEWLIHDVVQQAVRALNMSCDAGGSTVMDEVVHRAMSAIAHKVGTIVGKHEVATFDMIDSVTYQTATETIWDLREIVGEVTDGLLELVTEVVE